MSESSWVDAVVAWLRAGYSREAPARGYSPLIGLLGTDLPEYRVVEIAMRLRPLRRAGHSVSDVDIGVAVMRRTHRMPTFDDIERVRHWLALHDRQ